MKLAGLKLGRDPRICGVITGTAGIKAAKSTLSAGADLLELRVDTLKERDPGKLSKAIGELRGLGAPIILTIRSKSEGGEKKISDGERLNIFTELAPLVDAVDIELSSRAIIREVVSTARKGKTKVIVSYHNFNSTPAAGRLEETARAAKVAGADIVKIATTAKNQGDLKRLAGLLLKREDAVVIAMGGRAGAKSTRVFFPLLGSLITYGSSGKATAPGQLTVKELRHETDKYCS